MYAELPPPHARRLLPSLHIIDVREAHEFYGELGHLSGAHHVPLADLARESSRWGKDDAILLVCRSGNRSGEGAKLLSELGFHFVHNLSGGLNAWHAKQLLSCLEPDCAERRSPEGCSMSALEARCS